MRTGRLLGGSATGKAGFLPAPGSAAARPDQEFPAEQPSHPSHSPETWAPSPRDPLPPTFIVPGVSKHSRPPSPKNAAEGKNGTVGSRSLQPSFAGLVHTAPSPGGRGVVPVKGRSSTAHAHSWGRGNSCAPSRPARDRILEAVVERDEWHRRSGCCGVLGGLVCPEVSVRGQAGVWP